MNRAWTWRRLAAKHSVWRKIVANEIRRIRAEERLLRIGK